MLHFTTARRAQLQQKQSHCSSWCVRHTHTDTHMHTQAHTQAEIFAQSRPHFHLRFVFTQCSRLLGANCMQIMTFIACVSLCVCVRVWALIELQVLLRNHDYIWIVLQAAFGTQTHIHTHTRIHTDRESALSDSCCYFNYYCYLCNCSRWLSCSFCHCCCCCTLVCGCRSRNFCYECGKYLTHISVKYTPAVQGFAVSFWRAYFS